MTAPLVLASASPRRRELLGLLGIAIEVRPAHIAEVRAPGEAPDAYVIRLAREKAAAVAGDWVLAADTTVALDGELLEKPVDAADALRMLRALQGRTHHVFTAVALRSPHGLAHALDASRVTFRPASDDELAAYVATGEPMDKAGAYGIQGLGSVLVERLEGDFYGVMGLPLRLVTRLLAEAGRPWRFPAAPVR